MRRSRLYRICVYLWSCCACCVACCVVRLMGALRCEVWGQGRRLHMFSVGKKTGALKRNVREEFLTTRGRVRCVLCFGYQGLVMLAVGTMQRGACRCGSCLNSGGRGEGDEGRTLLTLHEVRTVYWGAGGLGCSLHTFLCWKVTLGACLDPRRLDDGWFRAA